MTFDLFSINMLGTMVRTVEQRELKYMFHLEAYKNMRRQTTVTK